MAEENRENPDFSAMSLHEFMQWTYKNVLRKEFVHLFGVFCREPNEMDVKTGNVLKSNGEQPDINSVLKNKKIKTHVTNILNLMDSKLGYINDPKEHVRFSYNHVGKNTTKTCLFYIPKSISTKKEHIKSIGNVSSSSSNELTNNDAVQTADSLGNCSDNSSHRASDNFNSGHTKKQSNIISVYNFKKDDKTIKTSVVLTLCPTDMENNTFQKTEEEVKLVQINSDNIKDNLTLETSSKVENHSTSFNKKSKKILNLGEKSTIHLRNSHNRKRSESKIDSQHNVVSKKRKQELMTDESVNDSGKNTSDNVLINSDQGNDLKYKITNKKIRIGKKKPQLHLLCAMGEWGRINSILRDGFNPNVKDNFGWTPLHEAVKFGHLNVVKLLIEFGAFLNVPGVDYESPLYTAINYEQFDVAKLLLQEGADSKCINIHGNNAQSIDKNMWSKLSQFEIPGIYEIKNLPYESNEIVIYLNNVSLDCDTVKNFCQNFNVKSVKKILFKKQLKQITHIVVPVTKNNACDANFECLMGIANGICIVNQNWIVESLEFNLLKPCLDYEVSGTTSFVTDSGPKKSRLNKQKLLPKLFDRMNIHISGSAFGENISVGQLKEIVLEFGAIILNRVPNPDICPSDIIPYHCQDNENMRHVSTIILYCKDSKRHIKYDMNHLKAFPVSWFLETVQKFNII